MLPAAAGLPGAEELGLAEFIARFRRETSGVMWLGTVGAALAFVFLPILTIYVPLPSFLLPARLLDRHADALAGHPIYLVRSAGLMLKLVVGLHWASHPTIRAHLALPAYPEDPGTWRTT